MELGCLLVWFVCWSALCRWEPFDGIVFWEKFNKTALAFGFRNCCLHIQICKLKFYASNALIGLTFISVDEQITANFKTYFNFTFQIKTWLSSGLAFCMAQN